MTTLLEPLDIEYPAPGPIAVLDDPVVEFKAPSPIAIFELPVVFVANA